MFNASYAAIEDARLMPATAVSKTDTKGSLFALDTTFVLVFLAMDLGRSWSIGLDTLLMATTLIAFTVLPYFLPSSGDRPEFGRWVMGRSLLAAFGVTLGLILNQAVGTLLPEWTAFMPMTLLIIAAVLSLYFQLYVILKLRLAR